MSHPTETQMPTHKQENAMRQIRIGDVFTEAELSEAIDIVERNSLPNALLTERVVTDEVMARINASTGQENSRIYMAYALENAVKTVARYQGSKT